MAPRRPTLILNPADDDAFRSAVESAFDPATGTARTLQATLRDAYPDAVVRPRDLASDPETIWYVYRDGHWVRRDGS
jgi:hypothetical protein